MLAKRMKWLVSSMVALSFFVLSTAQAQPAQASAELESLLGKLHTMQANFNQTVYDNRGKAVQKAHGTMAIDRPGKFRWQVIKPIPQLIVANQSRLWIYDPDLEQVTIRGLSHTAGETPALLLSHENMSIAKSFNVSVASGKANDRLFTLVPREADSMFASIQLRFVNNQIEEMRLKDHLDHTTSIEFTNIKTNLALSSSLFNFKAPKGADIIDETRKR